MLLRYWTGRDRYSCITWRFLPTVLVISWNIRASNLMAARLCFKECFCTVIDISFPIFVSTIWMSTTTSNSVQHKRCTRCRRSVVVGDVLTYRYHRLFRCSVSTRRAVWIGLTSFCFWMSWVSTPPSCTISTASTRSTRSATATRGAGMLRCTHSPIVELRELERGFIVSGHCICILHIPMALTTSHRPKWVIYWNWNTLILA